MKTIYGGRLRHQQVVGSTWTSAGGHHCCITGVTVNIEGLSHSRWILLGGGPCNPRCFMSSGLASHWLMRSRVAGSLWHSVLTRFMNSEMSDNLASSPTELVY